MTGSTELARRAVACKHWRWMPGMLVMSTNNYHRPARIESLDGDCYGLTVIPGDGGPVLASHHEWGVAGSFPRGCTIPDLADPATLGCLLALVREAWGDPEAHAMMCHDSARVRITWLAWRGSEYRWIGEGKTEAEALVAALEAAP